MDNTPLQPLSALKPIMYGMLQQSSLIDFEGHLSKVFFTAGCNMRCGFCHNHEMVYASEGNLAWDEIDKVLQAAREEWVDGIVITGGEPTLHRELKAVVRNFKKRGFKVKLDTNGSFPERLGELIGEVDYIAMDYKTSLARYTALAGEHIDPSDITASVKLLQAMEPGTYEFRTTIITDHHTDEVMMNIADELVGADRYVLQPFVPQDSLCDPDFVNLERTSASYLEYIQSFVTKTIENTVIRGTGL